MDIFSILGHIPALIFMIFAYIWIPLVIVGVCYYVYRGYKYVEWVFFWENRCDENMALEPEAPAPKKNSKKSATVVSDFSDEYKLPQLPFN